MNFETCIAMLEIWDSVLLSTKGVLGFIVKEDRIIILANDVQVKNRIPSKLYSPTPFCYVPVEIQVKET